jgi:hypothetical protein
MHVNETSIGFRLFCVVFVVEVFDPMMERAPISVDNGLVSRHPPRIAVMLLSWKSPRLHERKTNTSYRRETISPYK